MRSASGALPLLAPMSEVAGRLAPQIGAHFLERGNGGRGVLLGGAPGVRPARVVVIGAGTVGTNAAWIAQGMEAEVILIDRDLDRLRVVDQIHRGRIMTLASSRAVVERSMRDADLVIGAVLVPGGRAPVVATEDMVAEMVPGSVIVDVAVDQGGCIETTVETTHEHPVVERHGVLHYGVGNIPAAVPHTSTYALTNATFPYALAWPTTACGARSRPTPPSAAACCARRDSSPTRRSPRRSGGRAVAPLDALPRRRPRPGQAGSSGVGEPGPEGLGPLDRDPGAPHRVGQGGVRGHHGDRRRRRRGVPSSSTMAWSAAFGPPGAKRAVTPRAAGRLHLARAGAPVEDHRDLGVGARPGWRGPTRVGAGRAARSRHHPSGRDPMTFMPSTTQCTKNPPRTVGGRGPRTTIRV